MRSETVGIGSSAGLVEFDDEEPFIQQSLSDDDADCEGDTLAQIDNLLKSYEVEPPRRTFIS